MHTYMYVSMNIVIIDLNNDLSPVQCLFIAQISAD